MFPLSGVRLGFAGHCGEEEWLRLPAAISADRRDRGPRKFNSQTVISPRPNIAMTLHVDLLEEDFKYYNSVKQVVLIVRLNIPRKAG